MGPLKEVTFTATASSSGSLLIGSSREMGTWDPHPSAAVITDILTHAATFLPDLSTLVPETVATRVGLRPFSTRGHPLIGPVQGWRCLYVAAGHEGSGITLGPATAEVVKDWLIHGRPKRDVALAFLP